MPVPIDLSFLFRVLRNSSQYSLSRRYKLHESYLLTSTPTLAQDYSSLRSLNLRLPNGIHTLCLAPLSFLSGIPGLSPLQFFVSPLLETRTVGRSFCFCLVSGTPSPYTYAHEILPERLHSRYSSPASSPRIFQCTLFVLSTSMVCGTLHQRTSFKNSIQENFSKVLRLYCRSGKFFARKLKIFSQIGKTTFRLHF